MLFCLLVDCVSNVVLHEILDKGLCPIHRNMMECDFLSLAVDELNGVHWSFPLFFSLQPDVSGRIANCIDHY
jgi:hypothetical protein